MIMAADLNRPVACVGDWKRDGGSVLVQDDLARCWKNLARYHICLRYLAKTASGETSATVNARQTEIERIIGSLANWIVNGNELGAVGKRRFHLHLADHFADAFHDLIAGQHFAACGHELGNGPAVACPLHDDVGYERDAFGIVELDASGKPSASDKRRERDHQLVSFARREIHEILQFMAGFSRSTSSALGRGWIQVLR